MKQILVTKRNGIKEEFNPEKIHQILFWATEDITGVSVSQIEIKSQLQLYPGIPTDEIHEIMIATAHELISEETPNYQWVASRLRLFQLRKESLGQYEPWPLKELVERNINLGYYTDELLQWYSEDDWIHLDTIIDHSRDFNHSFAGMEQFHGKYLVQNRVTKVVYETPQYLNLLISATLFHKYPIDTRMNYIKDFYDCLSNGDISLPTPVMAGLRTKVKQFSSCVLIEAEDTLDSINATTNAIVDYISRKAGIGIEGGHIRAIDSSIRNGDARHTGIQPFYRLWQSAVKSCSQGGVRGGAATLYAPIWHLEIENILTLKSNTRTEETAVRHMDYGIQFCGLFYERLIKGENITLFSPHEVTDMHEAFFSDQVKFRELYEMYERKTSVTKSTIPAIELFTLYHTQRKETGRIYKLNVDHANTHSSFDETVAPIRMSNLCVSGDTEIEILDLNGNETKVKISDLMALSEDMLPEVLSANVNTNKTEWKQIIAFAEISNKARVLKITDTGSDRELVCTPEHEIYTKNRGYIMAKDLNSDDNLVLSSDLFTKSTAGPVVDGQYSLKIEVIKVTEGILIIEELEEEIPVYDITVKDNENFYANGILVHNCAEITLPTKPLRYPNDPEAEIALCTLSAFNLGKIKTKEDMERPLELLVRALNELLDYQEYPVLAAKNATMKRRPLGIGIFNLAYWLAKNNYKYSDDSSLVEWAELMEAFQYYLIKASMELAKERGSPCPGFNETKYSKGLMTVDTYKTALDDLVPDEEYMDWDWLRGQIAEHGMMNSTLSSGMPSETSSQIANATNGFEPPRGYITIKGSGEGRLKQVVPGYPRLKNKYELAWDMPNAMGYLNIVAVAQKYFDQSISANTWYNPSNYPDDKIPMSTMMKDDLNFYSLGGKTLYYFNTYDGQTDAIDDDEDCIGGGCKL